MSIRSTMEEALQRGEKIKEQFLTEMMNSSTVNQLLQNDLFIKSLTKVLNTKYELKRAFKTNFKSMLKVFNVPSRDEISSMERKIHRLENEIDVIHRKMLTTRLASSKSSRSKSNSNTAKKKPKTATKRSKPS